MDLAPEEMARRIRGGALVADAAFDLWLPDAARAFSNAHWTQVGVAMRVARWLAVRNVRRVLDVGSGAGKFCVVGALASTVLYEGIEHRRQLIEAAKELAGVFGVEQRTAFRLESIEAVDADRFDAYYFYNPFEENLQLPSRWIDRAVELGPDRFRRDTLAAELLLRRMRVGTYVVTYNGFGGCVPDCFELELSKPTGRSLLRVWRKVREHEQGACWIELEDMTVFKRDGWGALGRER
jgi:hypothetical protein